MIKYEAFTRAKFYDILLSPVVTEKSIGLSAFSKFVFKVAESATKLDIKKAVESIFSVKVKAVNIIVCKGRSRHFRGRKGWISGYKKAIVTLVEGSAEIDFDAF